MKDAVLSNDLWLLAFGNGAVQCEKSRIDEDVIIGSGGICAVVRKADSSAVEARIDS